MKRLKLSKAYLMSFGNSYFKQVRLHYTGPGTGIVLYSHCLPHQTMHLVEIMIKNGGEIIFSQGHCMHVRHHGVAAEGRWVRQKRFLASICLRRKM